MVVLIHRIRPERSSLPWSLFKTKVPRSRRFTVSNLTLLQNLKFCTKKETRSSVRMRDEERCRGVSKCVVYRVRGLGEVNGKPETKVQLKTV